MNAIDRIAMDIIDVHAYGFLEICPRLEGLERFACHNALDAMGKRRVTSGIRFVEGKVPDFLRFGKQTGEQKLSQDQVGLLENPMPVDDQRMVMEQKRIVFLWGIGKRPVGPIEERIILCIDAFFTVKGNTHSLGSLFPTLQFIASKLEGKFLSHLKVQFHQLGSKQEILPCHQIRIGIVVHTGTVFIRTGYFVDAKSVALGRNIASQADPHPCRFDGHLYNPGGNLPSGGLQIFLRCIQDIGIDMILGRSRRVVGTAFIPADSPPRKQCPLEVHGSCPFT